MTAALPSPLLDSKAVQAMWRTLDNIRRPPRRSRRSLLRASTFLRQPPPAELTEHLMWSAMGVEFR